MLRYVRSTLRGLAIAAVVAVGPAAVAAPHDGPHEPAPTDRVFTVDKNGKVHVKHDVRIGQSVLKKGKYWVQHQVERDAHAFVFTEIPESTNGGTSRPIVLQVTSKHVLRGEKTRRTTVLAVEEKDRSYTVAKIAVAGENMDHTF